jgi:curved DNA-binding protein CbpA
VFDPYFTWLGIPKNQRPPTHYQLLNIPSSEYNREVIEAAAARQMNRVRPHQKGPNSAEAQRLLGEITEARDTLLDPRRRRIYDATSPDAAPWKGTPVAAAPAPAATAAPRPTAARPAAPRKSGDTWWHDAEPEAGEVPATATARPPVNPPPAAPAPAATAPLSLDDLDDEVAVRRPPRRHSGNGLLIALGVLMLVAAAGVVAFVAINKTKEGDTAQTPPEDIVKGLEFKELPVEVPVPKVKAPPEHEPKENLIPKKTPPIHTPEPKQPPKSPPEAGADDLTKPRQYKGHKDGVQAIALAPDGKSFVTAGLDQLVHSWPLSGGEPTRLLKLDAQGVGAVFLNDRTLACCDGGTIFVFDPATPARPRKLSNPRGGMQSLAALPDGQHVLAGCNDGVLRLWDVPAETIRKSIDVGADLKVTAVAVSGDGKLAAAGFFDGTIGTWSLPDGKPVVKRWKAHPGPGGVTALALDADGKRLLSAGADKLGGIWEPRTGKPLAKLSGHDNVPLAVAWLPDGNRVVTAGSDSSVRLWQADTGKPENWSGTTDGKGYCLAVDPQARFVLIGTGRGIVERLPLPPASK